MDAYEALYCDSKKWINEGWVDYIAPQLYVRNLPENFSFETFQWPIDSSGQPFEPLFDWWLEQNYQNRHVIPGLFTKIWSVLTFL